MRFALGFFSALLVTFAFAAGFSLGHARTRLPPGLYAIPATGAYDGGPVQVDLGIAPKPVTASIRLPALSAHYRWLVERETQAQFGLNAPTARVAAQLHVESRWKADAKSPYAQGLAQFIPSTATWLAEVYPEECAPPDPWDADWSIRCAIKYDRYLFERVRGATECDRWAFALASYNGGMGWLERDRRAATAAGLDRHQWFGQVEKSPDTRRNAAAVKENRAYVRQILLEVEPAYRAAGWSGEAVCT